MAGKKMSRHEMRRSAFLLTFERIFNSAPVEELLEVARECEEIPLNDQAVALFTGVDEKKEILDAEIAKHLKNWTLPRISKVALAVLRVAMYEILYVEDMETDIVISEAVRLTQEFSVKDDISFVNGVLSAKAKALSE